MHNVVVLYAHPYDGSFNKGILDRVVKTLEKRGANVKVKDLVKMKFNATMQPEDLKAAVTKEYTEEVKREQDDILWADTLVTIAPVWFGSAPGFLKGYFDKVFISGFAYKDGEGLLRDKRVFSLFTFGALDPYLGLTNQYKVLEMLWDNIFGMVGFVDVALKYFTQVPSTTDEKRKEYLDETEEFINQIFDTKLGEIGSTGNARLLTKLASRGYLNGKIDMK
ncbi:NAD(P)H-dependent oxidoreductase [Niallia taxi]|uniref:NAD(P)H-dependent oxidoreductase n=1 Tax=Niallia taxi TaxID=2499688 RepID=UPI0039825C7B